MLGLGSNLGGRERWLDLAREVLLSGRAELLRETPRWNTLPRGGPPQPDYLNQLLLLQGPFQGMGWLELAEAAELAAGRHRAVPKGPRTLDVDVLLVEGLVSRSARLRLPHPAILSRPHLLAGVAALVPDWELEGGSPPLWQIARRELGGSWLRPVPVREAGGRPRTG